MKNDQERVAPEHMARYNTEQVGPNTWMHWVRCVCGWSWIINAGRWSPQSLINGWENHAYNAEDQSILRELEEGNWGDG